MVRLRICPGGEGIAFARVDLPGAPRIPARLDSVVDTQRNTTLGVGEARVHTVEHLMSALWAAGVWDAVVEIDGPEVPLLDGSALPFLEELEQQPQAEPLELQRPVAFSEGNAHLVALPHEGFKVSYTLHYPQCAAIRSQYMSLELDSAQFRRELAPCRTFVCREEVEALQRAGLIKGGGLDNAVVFDGAEVLNEEGLRFGDEPVRHKMLDLVGDLALLGAPLKAHIIAICGGHRAHVALGHKIVEAIA
jgi:UDP-3-O-[3-hydroxymyristoyl] N-acetylglucosamine deacetylase